jgi:hypothetical protein
MLCAMAQAQTTTTTTVQPKLHYGVKADLNLSTVTGNGMSSTYVAGGELGGFVDYDLNKKWGLQGEVLASQEMVKRNDDFMVYYNTTGNAFSNEDVKLLYLNVPLLVRYHLNDAWSFVAGPQVGFLLNDDENLLDYNARAFKTYEISGNVGGEFNISNVALFLRYNFGISNINDVDTRYQWRSQHVQMGIAVRIK